ncbi:hypothetical protein SAMN03097699_1350 [Flavobacteriaceae bacterium MAR_2010_188]|nr:hypothetical protein SAMN03097699_1350 [Flavobacteriaceae bacterium MAR_2010_188]
MKISKTLLALALTLFTMLNVQAQNEEEDDKLSLNDGTIDNQFEYVISRSNNYQDYKVVKKNWLATLKEHTIDSLQAIRKDLIDTQAIVKAQSNEIEALKKDLGSTTETLDQTKVEKDNMSLFGIQMSKGSYNVLMWSIIAALLALLLFFIFRYKNSNSVTRLARKSLEETEEEFEEHRRTALEREQKVRRQLQDELNKQKNS